MESENALWSLTACCWEYKPSAYIFLGIPAWIWYQRRGRSELELIDSSQYCIWLMYEIDVLYDRLLSIVIEITQQTLCFWSNIIISTSLHDRWTLKWVPSVVETAALASGCMVTQGNAPSRCSSMIPGDQQIPNLERVWSWLSNTGK